MVNSPISEITDWFAHQYGKWLLWWHSRRSRDRLIEDSMRRELEVQRAVYQANTGSAKQNDSMNEETRTA